jgi:hypothetical protein
MSQDGSPPGAALARRRFLGALALAPAALAGCATAGTRGGDAPGGAASQGARAPSRLPAPDAATRAVRGLTLPPDAEPAFVFRAGTARPGEP